MNDKINENAITNAAIHNIPQSSFEHLNDEQKNIVLAGNNDAAIKDKDSGKMGAIIGANTKNASLHIALIICAIMLLLCVMDLIHSFFPEQKLNLEMWNLIFPVVTLALGYIFGKGGTK